MTVSAAPPFNTYTGNGVTTVFAYGFRILDAAHLKVYLGGVLTASGYTVSGVGAAGGGSVTFGAAPGNGVAVLLKRSVPRTRTVDYVTNGNFTAEDIDNDQDQQTMLVQDIAAEADRSIKAPGGEAVNDLPAVAARAGKMLAFDANGHPVVVDVGSSSDPNLRADLAAAGGAALVGFTLGGSVESKLKWPIVGKASGYTAVKADHATLLDFAASGTLNYTAAATLGSGWWCLVQGEAGATVTHDPAGAELINGAATLVAQPGELVLVMCNGVSFAAQRLLIVDPTRADSVGFRGAPKVLKNAVYTFVTDDHGREFLHTEVTARIWTIDTFANQPMPHGAIILIVNWAGAGNITITPAGGVTLQRLDGTAGTGSRVIPPSGFAALHHVTDNEWGISGVFS